MVVVLEGGAAVVEVVVGAVVLVVVVVEVLVVVDEVVLVAGTVDVVVVVAAVGADGDTTLWRVVPLSGPPKMAASGFPEISSTAVMNKSAMTNTTAAVPAMTRHENRVDPPAVAGRRPGDGPSGVASAPGCSATDAARRWVSSGGAPAEAISAVGSCTEATASVGAEAASTSAPLARAIPVDPRRRSSGEESGARTTTCRTASCPRSIDWATRAVPIVAAIEPMATPMTVPLTPKLDAMRAAMTAPEAEARIWRTENFTPGVFSRP